ncbi:MAG: crossover junction endodeoxyribonuclease RuvC [Rikenellaceae bacterium]
MGIDPGTNAMGYGVISVDGNKISCQVLGIIDLHKIKDPYTKLDHIFRRVKGLIEAYNPDEVALESPFFGKNVQSMMKLGRAQGVAMAAALNCGKTVSEYAPRRIKQAVAGSGSASKQQVAMMLRSLLKINDIPDKLDATDGLAVAVCHYLQSQSEQLSTPQDKKKKALGGGRATGDSWERFVEKNPERIKK